MKFTFRRGLASGAAAALMLGAAVTTSTAAHAADDDSDELVMYVTNWDAIDTVKRLDASGAANHITTINYAFGDVAPRDLSREEASGHPDFPETGLGMDWEDYDEDEHGPIVCKPVEAEDEFFRTFSAEESISGQEEEGGLIRQLELLKEKHPQIKILPSLGGATLSKWFSIASQTEESRATLIDSCVDLWINGNYTDADEGEADNFAGVFDGVDLDWEFPAYVDPDTGEPEDRSGNELSISANDAENYALLAKEFRPALEDALGGETWVTAATPASPWTGDGYDFPALAEHLDWYAVMAYDLHGTWEDEVGYGAGIEDKEWGVSDTVDMYINANGVDPRKVVLGVPFYGPSWDGVEPEDDGSFFYEGELWGAPAMLGVDGDPDRDYNWREIKALVENEGLEIQWDDEYQAAFIYDDENQKFYSFDDPRALNAKIDQLINEFGLRGAMAWEFDADTNDAELTHVLADGLNIPYVDTVPLPDAGDDNGDDNSSGGSDSGDDNGASSGDGASSSDDDDEEPAGAVTLEPSYTG